MVQPITPHDPGTTSNGRTATPNEATSAKRRLYRAVAIRTARSV